MSFLSKKALRIVKLIKEKIQPNQFEGAGIPEPLKNDLSGSWSRFINKANAFTKYRFAGKRCRSIIARLKL